MRSNMLITIILIVLSFLLVTSFWGFWNASHPQKIVSNTTPKDLGWNFEDITLTTSDSIKLSAWFVPADSKKNKAIILLHGYPADKGDLLDWAAFLKEKYNLLFLDFRYFGKSEGSYTSLGVKETKDILATIEFLKNKGVQDIGLMGFSFGASVALLTLPHTSDVKAVLADAPFANLDLMGKVYYGNTPILNQLLTNFTKVWGRIIYGIDADKASVDKIVKTVKTPIFLIASSEDDVVSVENTQKLKWALKDNKNAQVVILDKGRHGSLSGESYQKLILDFFEKYL